jgi:hypothetical protein
MQLTLQEIADAAVRDFDARCAKRRRAGRAVRDVRSVTPKNTIRINLPIPVYAEGLNHPPHQHLSPPLEAPVPTTRYLRIFTAGVVLLAAGCLVLAWAHTSAAWREEARAQRRELILQQGMALHGQIKTLALQAERQEEKARTLLQYSSDLRYSFYGNAGAREAEQAESVLVDRDRLLAEIAVRRQQLSDLSKESAVLNARQ